MRRRLNRSEYENALRDMLHAPWLLISDQLPEDGEAFRFNKVSTALDVSYVHLTRYMAAAESAGGVASYGLRLRLRSANPRLCELAPVHPPFEDILPGRRIITIPRFLPGLEASTQSGSRT